MEKSRIESALPWCGVVAGVLFTGTYLITGALRPGYRALRDPVSSLALTDTGWIQIANFLLAGLLLAVGAVGLRRAGLGRPTTGFVALWAIGLLGSGVFVTDPVGDYPGPDAGLATPTWHGQLHDVPFGLLSFGAMAAAMTAHAVGCARARRRGWAAYSAVSAVALLAAFVVAGLGFEQRPDFVAIAGGAQRVAISLGWLWIGAVAVARSPRRETSTTGVKPSPLR